MTSSQRTVADGRLVIPDHWPKWSLRCNANKSRGRGPCTSWAVIGMPTCRFHGSGGEKNRSLGQLRYLAWIVVGGPQYMPAEAYCRVALAAAFEVLIAQGKGSLDQQLKAALWLTQQLT